MELILESRSEKETEEFAGKIRELLPDGALIALHGDLGAGKTVFSRGFARALGVTENVSSPTFTIIQEYSLERGAFFFHIDLYRIENEQSALAFGIDEYFQVRKSWTLIEWPERIAKILPGECIHIHLEHAGLSKRMIKAEIKE